MIQIEIPGLSRLTLTHLVCDVNGTLALDGQLLPEVEPAFRQLRTQLNIHLISANTFGRQNEHARLLEVESVVLTPGNEIQQKGEFIRALGKDQTVAIGQGANDSGMLKEAALGICVLSREGTAGSTLLAADVIVPDIQSAFDLLLKPIRLAATLRR
jgi:soluble P-type ATPase